MTAFKLMEEAVFFYQINSKDHLSLNTNFRRQTDVFPIETNTFLKEGNSEDSIRTETSNDNSRDFFSSSLNYSDQLSTDMSLFSGFQFTSFVQGLNTDISNNFNNTLFVRSQARQQKYRITSLAFRMDLEKKYSKEIKTELGLTMNSAKAKARTQIQRFGEQTDLELNYDYQEQTFASYVQLSGELSDKVSYSAGLRLENNKAVGEFTEIEEAVIDRKNLNFFPKTNINLQIDSTKNLTLNYAKTISRPSFSNTSTITVFINPFLEGSNNINLIPSVTEEWSANFQWKSKSVYFGYSVQKNPVYYSIRFDEAANIAILSPNNLKKETGFDLSFGIPFTSKFWNATNWVTLSARKIEDASAAFGKTSPYLYFYTNHQFKIARDTTLSLGGWGLTKRREGIFKRNAIAVLDAAISKTFFDKLQCSLRFNDITRGMNFEESYNINGVSAEGTYFADGREISFALKYELGKRKATDYKDKKIDDNFDRIR